MNTIVRRTFIIAGILILWVSTSRQAMMFLSSHRDVNKWWGTYQCLNGDLVSMSYLDFVKTFNPGPDTVHLRTYAKNNNAATTLFMDGDSYTWHLGDSNFINTSDLIYINRDHGCNYHLDTSRKNILVIEISERFVWDYFQSLRIFDEICDSAIKKKNITYFRLPVSRGSIRYASMVLPFSIDDFFNPLINQNLQCNLFNYQFLMPLFESKAALNFYIFNRASGDVVISGDRQRLYLEKTVSYNQTGSSYLPVSQAQVEKLVANFNAIYAHYRNSGFSEVYLSIIPNPATIMQPQGYNNFIPLIQNNPALHMKTIDIYTYFKDHPGNYYYPGDTHWNKRGKQLWIDRVNELLQGK